MGRRLMKFPRGWKMLAERGFANTTYCYPNLNAQVTPAFLSGRDAFTVQEVATDREVAKSRYSCEVVFSRVIKEALLMDTIAFHLFRHANATNHWAHAASNLGAPFRDVGLTLEDMIKNN